MARRIPLVLAALLAGTVACVRRGVRDYPEGTVAGYYVNAFEEGNVFRTCDRRAFLLVAPEDFWKRHKQINDVAAEYARPIRVFAVVAATVEPLESSATRPAGTEGRLTVTRVYRMRRAGDDDCAHWLARR
jgi:hypothetical protein